MDKNYLSCARPMLLKVRHKVLLLLKLIAESMQSAVDLLAELFPALACATQHEHDLLQASEHDRADSAGALSDEVLQPRSFDMPEAQKDIDVVWAKDFPATVYQLLANTL